MLPPPDHAQMGDDSQSRSTRLGQAALDAVRAHPEAREEDRVVILIMTPEGDKAQVGGVAIGGYSPEEIDEREPLTDVLMHASGMAEAMGVRLRVAQERRHRRRR